MQAYRISTVLGTRPEVIKLAPLVRELQRHPVTTVRLEVVHQQGAILDSALAEWGLRADSHLLLDRGAPELRTLVAPIVSRLERARPDLVIVHGDTTTAAAAALAAASLRLPIAHVEAGLRSGELNDPFPEERNRCMISRLATWHFAPTPAARDNLLAEGVPAERVQVVGNTVVDSIALAERRALPEDLRATLSTRNLLATVHRRESYGSGVRAICTALRTLAARPDLGVLLVLHPNPRVQAPARALLDGVDGVTLLPPQSYRRFVQLMRASDLILTDSGGIQEEAPLLARPVLITRECTERPEGLRAGVARMVGRDAETIVAAVEGLLDDPAAYASMARRCSPYGSAGASRRIAERLAVPLRPAHAS